MKQLKVVKYKQHWIIQAIVRTKLVTIAHTKQAIVRIKQDIVLIFQ